jgi:NAD dependent epimerase/dehydratase family enzyme
MLNAMRKDSARLARVHERDHREVLWLPGVCPITREDYVITDPRFYRALAWGGTLGAGEAYINGWWSTDDLTALIRILIQNESAFST